MAKVKLSPTLPDDDSTKNGLDEVATYLLEHPGERLMVVAIIDNAKTEIDHRRSGTKKPTVGIVHIEVVPDTYRETVTRILKSVHRERVEGVVAEPLFQPASDGSRFDTTYNDPDNTDPLAGSEPGPELGPDLNIY